MNNSIVKVFCYIAKLAGMIPGSIERFVYTAVDKLSYIIAGESLPDQSKVAESPISAAATFSTDEAEAKYEAEFKTESETKSEPKSESESESESESKEITPSQEEVAGTKLSSVPKKYHDFCDQVLPPKRINPEK